jgi:hypothetical protein
VLPRLFLLLLLPPPPLESEPHVNILGLNPSIRPSHASV